MPGYYLWNINSRLRLERKEVVHTEAGEAAPLDPRLATFTPLPGRAADDEHYCTIAMDVAAGLYVGAIDFQLIIGSSFASDADITFFLETADADVIGPDGAEMRRQFPIFAYGPDESGSTFPTDTELATYAATGMNLIMPVHPMLTSATAEIDANLQSADRNGLKSFIAFAPDGLHASLPNMATPSQARDIARRYATTPIGGYAGIFVDDEPPLEPDHTGIIRDYRSAVEEGGAVAEVVEIRGGVISG